jgi:hypothetical protein
MKIAVSKFLALALGAAALIAISASVASAQTTDVYKLNYFSDNYAVTIDNVPVFGADAAIRIDNPGLTYGNLCAMIYVFDQDQQMTECCGCLETHNGLQTLSLIHNLTTNPLTGIVSNSGVIKVVSAAVNNSPCDPTSNVTPTKNLRAWATHIASQEIVITETPTATPPVSYKISNVTITETEFTDSPLGASELTNLQSQCSFIGILGSGKGICSCGGGG